MDGLELRFADVAKDARNSWSIVTAAIPATIVFLLAAAHLLTAYAAFLLADIIGVLSLAVVGIGTAGGKDRPLSRRIFYVLSLIAVGVSIVLLEAGVHLL